MSSLGTLWAEGQVSWRGTRFLRLMLQDSTVASPRERVRSKPQILRGCEADLVRHGQGGWARRRASAGREVGPLPGLCPAAPRASEPPVSGWQPSRGPAPAGPGGRRSPRGPLPTHVPHSAGTGRAGRGGPGSGLGPRDGVGGAGQFIRAFTGPTRARHPPPLSRGPLGRQERDCGALTNFQRHGARPKRPEPRAAVLPSALFFRLWGPGLQLLRGRGSGCALLADALPLGLVGAGTTHKAPQWHGDL